MGFRLMTANLLVDRVDVSHFDSLLDEHSPDVIVVQELAPGPAEVLRHRYPHHHLVPSLDAHGGGIATTFDADFGEIGMPGRGGTWASLLVDDVTLRLAGVHLLNPIDFPWWAAARGRGQQLDVLFSWLDEGHQSPVLVAGDLNASARWPAYKRVNSRLTDLVAQQNPHPERTWAWRPGWPRLLRIDHVFGTGVVASSSEVVPMIGSDHCAVIVDLEVVVD